jgi:antitoxin MazE
MLETLEKLTLASARQFVDQETGAAQFVHNVYHCVQGAKMVKISKWGNSLGMRVPRHVAQMLGLKAGDVVFIRVDTETKECIMVPARKDGIDNRYFSPTIATPPIKIPKKDTEKSFLCGPPGW